MFDASNIFSVALKLKAIIPVVSLPTIVAFYIQSFVYVSSLSSPLLLRISPQTFVFIPIPPIGLSSRNRSIFNTFRHVLPCIIPVCKGMHYHKTGVPWQMNSTFTFILNLLILIHFLLILLCIWRHIFAHISVVNDVVKIYYASFILNATTFINVSLAS